MTNGSYVVIYQNKNWTTSVSGVSYNYLDVNNWSYANLVASYLERMYRIVNALRSSRLKQLFKNLFGDEDPVR